MTKYVRMCFLFRKVFAMTYQKASARIVLMTLSVIGLVSCGGAAKDSRLVLGFGVTQSIFVPYSDKAPSSCSELYGSGSTFSAGEPGSVFGSTSEASVSAQAENLNYYLKFSYPTIQWNSDTSTAEIIMITFKIKHSNINGGQEYSQVIDSGELSSMYARAITSNGDGTYTYTDPWSPTKLPWYASTAPTTPIKSKTPNTNCSYFLLKGIPITKKRAFTGNATFEVIAIETLSDGTQKPIQTSTTVAVESVGI